VRYLDNYGMRWVYPERVCPYTTFPLSHLWRKTVMYSDNGRQQKL